MDPPANQARWRVKLYQLNNDGQWDDRGTGEATVWIGTDPYILVASEEANPEQLFRGSR